MHARSLSLIALAAAAALSAGWSAHAQTITLGPIVNPSNGHTYYRFTTSNWTQARTAALALGGDLVTINDANENEFVHNTFFSGIASGRLWIGYNDAASEGNFVWSNGESPGYTNWTSGEPDNAAGAEDHVVMVPGTRRWDDVTNLPSPFGIGPCYGVAEIPTPPAPANDLCSNAIDVSAGGTFNGTLAYATFTAGDIGAGCGGGAASLPDVWYLFRTPSFCDGRLTVTTCGTNDIGGIDAGLNTVLSLRNFCTQTELACNDDGFGDFCGSLDDGAIRDSLVTRDVAGNQFVGIRVSAFQAPPPAPFFLRVSFVPANDECTSPTTISAGVTTVWCNTVATPSVPNTETGCAGVPSAMNRDLWYRYTPVTSGVFTVRACSTMFNAILAAYSACPSAPGSALTCNDDTPGCGTGNGPVIRVSGAAGTPVLLRYGMVSGAGLPQIEIFCPADFNLSYAVSVQDIFDFLAAYFGGDPRANINGVGGISVQDIFDFLEAYFTGC